MTKLSSTVNGFGEKTKINLKMFTQKWKRGMPKIQFSNFNFNEKSTEINFKELTRKMVTFSIKRNNLKIACINSNRIFKNIRFLFLEAGFGENSIFKLIKSLRKNSRGLTSKYFQKAPQPTFFNKYCLQINSFPGTLFLIIMQTWTGVHPRESGEGAEAQVLLAGKWKIRCGEKNRWEIY